MFRAMVLLAVSLTSFSIVDGQTTITGTLVGQNGRPMLVENVILMQPMVNTAINMVTPDKEGRYAVTVDSSGIWILRYAGVNHYNHDVVLDVDKPGNMKIDVRLKGYGYADSLKDVKIIGDFNHFSFPSAAPMEKHADGTYTAEFETRADSFAYQIVGVEMTGHSINGTQSERYVYDGGGDYRSVVAPKDGKVRVVFDPSKLVRWSRDAVVTFGDTNSMAAKFAEIYDEMQHNQQAFTEAFVEYRNSGKDLRQFKYDWSKEVESLKRRIEEEKTPVLRQELLLDYVSLGAFGAKMDSAIALRAITEISPASLLWSTSPFLIQYALRFAHATSERRDAYVHDVIDENPSIVTRAALLYAEFMEAKLRNDDSMAAKYYDILVGQYGDTEYGKVAKERFSPKVNVQVGKPVPAFSVASLDDSTNIITNQSLRGKYYLMDFWATWCGPCVAEMANLQSAFEKFKDKNFVILSLSLDASARDVAKFREEKWKMPWLHTFVGMNSESKILKDFDVVSIPKPILVDGNGTVIAIGDELRGEGLEKTLEKYLGK